MFKSLEREVRSLTLRVIELVYFMRGSIQYDDMMWRTPFERDLIAEFIEGRMETEAKKPFKACVY